MDKPLAEFELNSWKKYGNLLDSIEESKNSLGDSYPLRFQVESIKGKKTKLLVQVFPKWDF